MAHAQLIIEVSQTQAGETVIVCEGALDLATAPDLSEAIAWSITRDLRRLRVDATKLTFCDSSGLRCLLEAAYQCQQHSARLELTASDRLARTLELVGLHVTARDGTLIAELSSAVTDAVAAKITPTPSPAK